MSAPANPNAANPQADRGPVEDIAHDYNGDFYVVGQQGELEESLSHRDLLIMERDQDVFKLGAIADDTNPGVVAAMRRTMRINYWHLCSLEDRIVITREDAKKIAYLRTMALSSGLVDVKGTPGDHQCMYTDVRLIDDSTTFTVYDTVRSPNSPPIDPAKPPPSTEKDYADAIPDWAGQREWREKVKPKIANMVCMVAFFMRTRGHHWTRDSNERYVAVWRRCLYDEDTPGISWEYVAHHSFHCIFPDDLDAFWKECVDEAKCAGALIKRFTSYAAGTAAVGAVGSGADDVSIVFPALRNLVPQAFDELERCRNILRTQRWAGSINRRFYKGNDLVIDERRLGSLAAVIIGALTQAASSSPLRKSPALIRVANNAPITGAIITNVIMKASQDDRMTDSLFAKIEDVD